ncbi:F0F1 ATP synthase subunit epsilon [Methyloterricola oryzae]|uniref:F0F1 ATP synthase subunit epsilon n=1 Tax=Methyloterricola oryzae TaxID=1495050 RepID=UPI0005EB9BA2|nr:F0F1 ATP synthase subunit epsilon [Methyloterricola oryzae]
MAMKFHVDIVSAEEQIFSGLAELVVAPAEEGDVGIAARHAPLLTRLKPGEVRVMTDDKETLPFYVSGGILEIQPHIVSVLADRAVRAKDIDEAAALEAKQRAEEALKDQKSAMDMGKVQRELVEAMEQLRTLERWRQRR